MSSRSARLPSEFYNQPELQSETPSQKKRLNSEYNKLPLSSFQIVSSLVLSVVCMVIAVTAIILTVLELSTFRTVSYKNYGQAVSEQFYKNILISKLFFQLF